MYITSGKVFGGTPNIFMCWLFPENGSISERTVNRALIVHTTLWNSALTKIYINFHFRHVPKLSIGFKKSCFSLEELAQPEELCTSYHKLLLIINSLKLNTTHYNWLLNSARWTIYISLCITWAKVGRRQKNWAHKKKNLWLFFSFKKSCLQFGRVWHNPKSSVQAITSCSW